MAGTRPDHVGSTLGARSKKELTKKELTLSIVDCAVYEDGSRHEVSVSLADAYAVTADESTFVWVGLHEPTEEEFAQVRKAFDLPELAVEDAIKAHQRPKLEVYDEILFLVLKSAAYDDEAETIALGEIMVFVGQRFVVTVRHGEMTGLGGVRRGLERQPEMLRYGPSAVLHAILDRVVDAYAPIMVELATDIQQVEEEVFSARASNPVERIYKLKREVLKFNQATSGLVEPLELLARGRVPQGHPALKEYFRDVSDHVVRVVNQVEDFRDLLTSVLEANLTQVSVRQNEDMRKISAWVAIAAVPTMIAGIYGMNFDWMPALHVWYGYPVTLAAMVLCCAALYRAFRRSGWL